MIFYLDEQDLQCISVICLTSKIDKQNNIDTLKKKLKFDFKI